MLGMKAVVGTSFEELDLAFIRSILPLVDVVEVIPDTLAVARGGERRPVDRFCPWLE